MTDGDMLSHRVMYYGLLKAFPNLNVISEEDDPESIDMDTIQLPLKTNADVDKIITDGDDVLVPIEEVDVWIDPLDATQEVKTNDIFFFQTHNSLSFSTRKICWST